MAAATAAAGTGAGLGYYRALAGAPGFVSQGLAPDLAQVLAPQPASSTVPSFVTPPGTGDTPPFLPVPGITPPDSTPGATPTAVPEPASAVILGMALVAFALARRPRRGGPGAAATGRAP